MFEDQGLDYTMTNRKVRLSNDVPSEYLHAKKSYSSIDTKGAGLFGPAVAHECIPVDNKTNSIYIVTFFLNQHYYVTLKLLTFSTLNILLH